VGRIGSGARSEAEVTLPPAWHSTRAAGSVQAGDPSSAGPSASLSHSPQSAERCGEVSPSPRRRAVLVEALPFRQCGIFEALHLSRYIGFTPGGHISTDLRINERIRVPEVRLVGPNGEQVGIVRIEDALRLASESDLDLVEVAPTARPPVCKLMDFGKFKYETAQKAREARKNQVNTVIKEIKLRPRIDPHDYSTKKGHVVRFLAEGDKVKVTVMFRRGREQSRPQLGFKLLQQLAEDVVDLGHVESAPRQDGRDMIMVLGPNKKKTAVRAERAARKSDGADAADDVDLDSTDGNKRK